VPVICRGAQGKNTAVASRDRSCVTSTCKIDAWGTSEGGCQGADHRGAQRKQVLARREPVQGLVQAMAQGLAGGGICGRRNASGGGGWDCSERLTLLYDRSNSSSLGKQSLTLRAGVRRMQGQHARRVVLGGGGSHSSHLAADSDQERESNRAQQNTVDASATHGAVCRPSWHLNGHILALSSDGDGLIPTRWV
jgi:hypothetical protein